jgi:two-component system OmpR family sensor kinase
MWDIGSKLRRRWLELAWALFAAANLTVILLLDHWETIPFHFIWVSLTLLYGLRVWTTRSTVTVLVLVMVSTGLALGWTVSHGAERPDELSEVPLMAGMFVAMVWHARRRQSATEEVRRLAESEHRLREREREFVQDASHELRTPITIARGHADLIRAHGVGQAVEDAGVILDELNRLSQISERLLILAAAEHPTFLRRTPFQLEELVIDVAKRWSAAASRRWRVDIAAEGTLVADEERLAAALDALVENAVKFTSEADQIAIVSRSDDGQAVIEISDQGEGIPADQLDRVFDRFARADRGRTRGTGGTGLGLPIARAIVEAHRGSIAILSKRGSGATFVVRLPGFTARPDPSPPTETDGPPASSTTRGRSGRVGTALPAAGGPSASAVRRAGT